MTGTNPHDRTLDDYPHIPTGYDERGAWASDLSPAGIIVLVGMVLVLSPVIGSFVVWSHWKTRQELPTVNP